MKPRELLIDTLDYLPPRKVLEGLSASDAERRIEGAPHSVAAIVAHMSFWQDWFLKRTAGEPVPAPEHASSGWPAVAPGAWPELRDRFLAGLEQAAALNPEAAIDPPLEIPPMAQYSVGDVIVHLAGHTAHHMGQVILLRQLMGRWPPPAGSFTW